MTKLTQVPVRIAAAVDLLAVRSSDHVLEIGCGNGAAAALVCERLGDDGRLVGIDRSETQISLARQHNRACIEAGKVVFHVMALEDATPDNAPFDVIFAINVSAFWLRFEKPLAAVQRMLKPDGAFYLFYEHPAMAKAREVPPVLRANLTDAGFIIEHESSNAVYCLKSTLALAKQRPQ